MKTTFKTTVALLAFLLANIVITLGVAACQPSAPPPPVVVVPGPAGQPGPVGATGATGAPGAGGTTIVVPVPVPPSGGASAPQ